MKYLYITKQATWQSYDPPTADQLSLFGQKKMKIYAWDEHDDMFLVRASVDDQPLWDIPEDRSPPVFDPVPP